MPRSIETCFPERYEPEWTPVNHQPGLHKNVHDFEMKHLGQSHIKYCPHYPLVEICADLVGITPVQLAKEPRFCGTTAIYVNTLAPLAGFRGYKHHPLTMCSKIHDQLKAQLELVQTGVVVDTAAVEEFLNSTLSFRDKKGVLDRAIEKEDLLKRQHEILTRWQGIIFETCCVSADAEISSDVPLLPGEISSTLTLDPDNFSFRQISSPRELSFDEVISRVASFMMALREQVTGDTDRASRHFYAKGALYCPRAPEYFEAGIHS